MDAICFHELDILWREWFGDEGATRLLATLLAVFVMHVLGVQDGLELQTLQEAKVLRQRKTATVDLSRNDRSKISGWCERSEMVRISFG
jgi:hypothetical protein